MKTVNNILKSASLLAMMSFAMTSCNDWLTVHPQTQIVEENFWEDKTDLEGVRYAAYKNMASQVDKMIIWGDMRSDIYQLVSVRTGEQSHRDNFTNIRQGEIDTTLNYFDWSGMYSTIGYCNKVLQHGEEILEKDKQFTASEWSQMKAEMVTMRALSYFYLVRAFKSIPFTTKVVNSDSDVEYFPQVPALDVLDYLIKDVESVAGKARNRFVSKADTKGMITNTAIYALLSDMYLWRGSMLQGRNKSAEAISDYNNSIRNAVLSINKLKEQFDEENKFSRPSADQFHSWKNVPQYSDLGLPALNIDFMYKNETENVASGDINLEAFYQIFDRNNSFESIFELQFSSSDGRKNTFPNHLWGTGNSATLSSTMTQQNKTDMRYWINGWSELMGNTGNSTDAFVLKWCAAPRPEITEGQGTSSAKIVMSTEIAEDYHNWIVWRLSDMLMNMAESHACLASLDQDKKANTENCDKLLRMVNRRWWVNVATGVKVEEDLAVKKDYDMSGDDVLQRVMDTRKVEFVAEGKRWFDLVRYAERTSSDDNDSEGMRAMFDKFMNSITGYETTRNRCESLWGLYCPIYYMECKAYRAGGAVLNQNPVWNKSKYDRK